MAKATNTKGGRSGTQKPKLARLLEAVITSADEVWKEIAASTPSDLTGARRRISEHLTAATAKLAEANALLMKKAGSPRSRPAIAARKVASIRQSTVGNMQMRSVVVRFPLERK